MFYVFFIQLQWTIYHHARYRVYAPNIQEIWTRFLCLDVDYFDRASLFIMPTSTSNISNSVFSMLICHSHTSSYISKYVYIYTSYEVLPQTVWLCMDILHAIICSCSCHIQYDISSSAHVRRNVLSRDLSVLTSFLPCSFPFAQPNLQVFE